jgi:hypothetical protein
MTKDVLSAAFVRYIFPERNKQWIEKSTMRDVHLSAFDGKVKFWFSVPELCESTGSVLAKSIDCLHNLTHLHVRSNTTGIFGIGPEAWKSCAKSGETPLKVSMVEDLLDKQSVLNAKTNFSVEVELWMRRNCYHGSANITSIIRNWYSACDDPGIPAQECVQKLLEMRQLLLQGVNFEQFPTPTLYVQNIPVVTFEGLLIDIDSKLQLYSICGPYNIRSVGSLVTETTVGILQSLNPVSSVSIKAVDVPRLMATTIEVMTCKLDPDR